MIFTVGSDSPIPGSSLGRLRTKIRNLNFE